MSGTDSTINPIARRGFQSSADAYERGRPGYPAGAIDFLAETCGIHQGAQVIELGAGTGKFTRLLIPTKAALLCVEPVEGMRRKFASLFLGIGVLEGSAENIPAADGAADAVLSAQAFHWFNAERALAECHRVLKPGGMLGLIWNVRDESVEWVAELARMVDVHAQGAPRYKSFEWKKPFEANRLFGPLHQKSFKHSSAATLETLMDRIASISFIASLPDGQRLSVMQNVRSLFEKQAKEGQAMIEMAYKTDVYWCEKI